MVKLSSSASGFWTAAHFPQPLLQPQVPSYFRNHLSRTCATGWQETEMRGVRTQGARDHPSSARDCRRVRATREVAKAGIQAARDPPCSPVLERAFGRATHGRYTTSANAFHGARDGRELRSARPAGEAEFPAGLTPLPLNAAEKPRPQVPPGREVLPIYQTSP